MRALEAVGAEMEVHCASLQAGAGVTTGRGAVDTCASTAAVGARASQPCGTCNTMNVSWLCCVIRASNGVPPSPFTVHCGAPLVSSLMERTSASMCAAQACCMLDRQVRYSYAAKSS